MKILVAALGTQYSSVIAAELSRRGYEVDRCEKNGRIFAHTVCESEYSAVVTDVFMAEIDFMAAAGIIVKKGRQVPPAFVLSGFDSPLIEKEVKKAGAVYYFIKPFDASVLADRVAQFLQFNSSPQRTDSERRASAVLQGFMVPPHNKGYSYLRDGVVLCLDDDSLLGSMMGRFYQAVAAKNNVTCGAVERAIRNAVEQAWARCDEATLIESFGQRGVYNKPTNSEFMAVILEKLRNEQMGLAR